jgi:hypothetical protein
VGIEDEAIAGSLLSAAIDAKIVAEDQQSIVVVRSSTSELDHVVAGIHQPECARPNKDIKLT